MQFTLISKSYVLLALSLLANLVQATPTGSPSEIHVDEFKNLTKRYTPISAKGKITLYHGSVDKLTGGYNFNSGTARGDFSYTRSFYMTDRERAAVQFACLNDATFYGEPDDIAAAVAYVYEFEWDGTHANVHQFTGISDPDWSPYQTWVGGCPTNCPKNEKFEKIHNSDMVAGPMSKEEDQQRGMTNNFEQYVVMNKHASDTYLKLKSTEPKSVKCDPTGRPGNFN